jgi:HEAT repeat protein
MPKDLPSPNQKHAARRRTVVVAGHRGDELLVREGLVDEAGAVRASALGALARMGRLGAAEVIAALTDDEPAVRRRACEVAAGLGPAADPGVGQGLINALSDDEVLVVESACAALGELGAGPGLASVTGLTEVAQGHSDPLCREAAVAALGSIGDPAGLPTILAAMNDKPTVRRRAVLALAPFTGPAVEEALTKARSDRDWQVRQSAEDLS